MIDFTNRLKIGENIWDYLNLTLNGTISIKQFTLVNQLELIQTFYPIGATFNYNYYGDICDVIIIDYLKYVANDKSATYIVVVDLSIGNKIFKEPISIKNLIATKFIREYKINSLNLI